MLSVDFSVGEPEEEMYRIINEITDILPKDRPRYLMGRYPWNILKALVLE